MVTTSWRRRLYKSETRNSAIIIAKLITAPTDTSIRTHRLALTLPASVQTRRPANICLSFRVDHSEFEGEEFELFSCRDKLVHWPKVKKSVIFLSVSFEQDKKYAKIWALLSNKGKSKHKQASFIIVLW